MRVCADICQDSNKITSVYVAVGVCLCCVTCVSVYIFICVGIIGMMRVRGTPAVFYFIYLFP